MAEEEICLVDGCANLIIRETKYFQTLTKKTGNIMTIAGSDALIVGTGRAVIVLPMGTCITVDDAFLYPESKRTLLSFKDIRLNRFHVETDHKNGTKYLLITKSNGCQKQVVKKKTPLFLIRIVLYLYKT